MFAIKIFCFKFNEQSEIFSQISPEIIQQFILWMHSKDFLSENIHYFFPFFELYQSNFHNGSSPDETKNECLSLEQNEYSEEVLVSALKQNY